MNRFDFLSAVGDIPENLISDAGNCKRSYKKPLISALGTVAACLIIVIIVNLWPLLFAGAGMEGPNGNAGGSDGAMPPNSSYAVSVYYLADSGEITSKELTVTDENQLLKLWRFYNGIPEDVSIYLASPLNLSPDGSFTVNVSVGRKIEKYYDGRDGGAILESLRLTVLSFMEEATAYEKITVTVAIQ